MNWRRELVNDIQSKMLPIIFGNINPEKIRPVFIETTFESLDGVQGFCMIQDEEDGEYQITLNRNQNREEIITNMVHELTHVMQVERGDTFDYSLPYMDQPHEIEAYSKQSIYADKYNTISK